MWPKWGPCNLSRHPKIHFWGSVDLLIKKIITSLPSFTVQSFQYFFFFLRMKLEITIFRIFMSIYILLSDIFIQCLLCNESFNFLFPFPLSLKRMDYGKKIKVAQCDTVFANVLLEVSVGLTKVCVFYECLSDCNYLIDLETCLYSCRH